MSRKVLGLIPARGGSKGIPRKNIIQVNGRPLLAYTIEAALHSRCVDMVAVSSEDKEILDIAKKFGAEPILRPAKLALDDSPNEPVILHALRWLKKNRSYVPDIIAYLLPTSPLRTAMDIDASIMLLLQKKAHAVVGVREISRTYLKTFIIERGRWMRAAVRHSYPITARQKLPNVYLANGAMFAVTRKRFMKHSSLLPPTRIVPYIMDEMNSIDIDTPDDLQRVQAIMIKYRKELSGDPK